MGDERAERAERARRQTERLRDREERARRQVERPRKQAERRSAAEPKPSARERRWAAARALTDALGGLAQEQNAGRIDQAQLEAEARVLVSEAPEDVRQAARRIHKVVREALRTDDKGGAEDEA